MVYVVCYLTLQQTLNNYYMEQQILDSAINIIQPVIESAVVIAGHYCKECGRSVLTSEDMVYATRYAAMNITGKQFGTLFPDIDSGSDSGSDIEEVDEDEYPFTRYSGDNKLMNEINDAYDNWDDWTPSSPIEKILKDSINIHINETN